jgi:hypothetical protein
MMTHLQYFEAQKDKDIADLKAMKTDYPRFIKQ